MGKKYYGGIGTDKGFVMHSPESKYHYSRDDEFHKEGDKRNVGSASNTGGGNSGSNDSAHNESSDESSGSVQSNFDAPYDDDCSNRDGELDDFFGDLLSIKACIALAIEGLFKAFMSRSMKRIDFVAVTLAEDTAAVLLAIQPQLQADIHAALVADAEILVIERNTELRRCRLRLLFYQLMALIGAGGGTSNVVKRHRSRFLWQTALRSAGAYGSRRHSARQALTAYRGCIPLSDSFCR